MIEKEYFYSLNDSEIIEKIITDQDTAISHAILSPNKVLPEHLSDAELYLIMIKGTLSIRLNDQEEQNYTKGSIINIPVNTKITISNQGISNLEFFAVKIYH